MGPLIVSGRYEVLAELGRGGMGIVFRAKQRSLDRVVAIKMLSRELANDTEFRGRFQQEAQIIARLQHDNIVRVYDIEQDRGTFFIIMEYVEGLSLQELLRNEGRLDCVRAAKLIAQVARALTFAHAQSIVHRDIKPDNIMVVRGDKAMVMDFGIARAEDSTLKTQTGISMGTPKYMSPEQARGVRVDHRSDLYSLGVVLFACVTGELPFTGDTPFTVALKHMQEPPPLPSEKVPGLPVSVEKAILRSLAKDPADRFQSGDEFAAALEAAIWKPGAKVASPTQGFDPTVKGVGITPSSPGLKAASAAPSTVIIPEDGAPVNEGMAASAAPKRKSKAGVLALAGVLLLAGGGAAYMKLSGGSAGDGQSGGSATARPTPTATQTTITPTPAATYQIAKTSSPAMTAGAGIAARPPATAAAKTPAPTLKATPSPTPPKAEFLFGMGPGKTNERLEAVSDAFVKADKPLASSTIEEFAKSLNSAITDGRQGGQRGYVMPGVYKVRSEMYANSPRDAQQVFEKLYELNPDARTPGQKLLEPQVSKAQKPRPPAAKLFGRRPNR